MHVFLIALFVAGGDGCTNFLIPAGSTKDGSTIISYSADSPSLFGDLYHWPAAKHAKGERREIWDWDKTDSCIEYESCKKAGYLGAIPEPEETYNVVGNTNEHQLSIGETTFGGLQVLSGSGGDGHGSSGIAVCDKTYGCLDYGQLIWVTLQRSKNVQEAITTIDHLMQTYGYASSGESFSIADTREVWLMELIGKGNFSKGAVWVAHKIPDGYVCGHANQARIRTFPRDQPDTVRYAADVVSFAREHGLYNGVEEDFSFSDVYDPVTFSGARFCEARVFSFFSSVAAPEENMDQYLDYVQGYNLSNRMPLYVKTNKRFTVNDTMWHMRNHYEGTWLDPSLDIGADYFSSPYRLGMGLEWKYKGKSYVNERPIGTQYAGWNSIYNQRPNQKYSVNWWGADDSTFSPHVPFYGAATRIHPTHSGANCTGMSWCRVKLGLPGHRSKFNIGSMSWITNMVANYAYASYKEVSQVVKERLVEHEARMFQAVEEADKKIFASRDDSVEVATQFSFLQAENTHQLWTDLYGELFMTFVDGYKVVNDATRPKGFRIESQGWSGEMMSAIAERAGKKYHVPENMLSSTRQPSNLVAIDKLCLRSMGGRHHGRCKDMQQTGDEHKAEEPILYA